MYHTIKSIPTVPYSKEQALNHMSRKALIPGLALSKDQKSFSAGQIFYALLLDWRSELKKYRAFEPWLGISWFCWNNIYDNVNSYIFLDEIFWSFRTGNNH